MHQEVFFFFLHIKTKVNCTIGHEVPHPYRRNIEITTIFVPKTIYPVKNLNKKTFVRHHFERVRQYFVIRTEYTISGDHKWKYRISWSKSGNGDALRTIYVSYTSHRLS